MPADTAEKRYSAMLIACPWRGVRIVPSAIDQAERQAVMFMYSGILATGAAPPSTYTLPGSDHHWGPRYMKKQRLKNLA